MTNLGEASTPFNEDICVLIKIDNQEICETCVGQRLAPGDTITIAANTCLGERTGWTAEKGLHDMRAYVNGDFIFYESNNRNNILDKTFRVRETSNLAVYADASASASDSINAFFPWEINDGLRDVEDKGWANPGDQPLPQWVTLEWDSTRTFNKTVVFSDPEHVLSDFRLQYYWVDAWVEIKSVSGNSNAIRIDSFPVVTSNQLRLECLKGPEDKPDRTLIRELEVYKDPGISLSVPEPGSESKTSFNIYPNPLDGSDLTIELD